MNRTTQIARWLLGKVVAVSPPLPGVPTSQPLRPLTARETARIYAPTPVSSVAERQWRAALRESRASSRSEPPPGGDAYLFMDTRTSNECHSGIENCPESTQDLDSDNDISGGVSR